MRRARGSGSRNRSNLCQIAFNRGSYWYVYPFLVALPAEQDPCRRLLFVDDDEAQRVLFTRTVAKAGFHADCAQTVDEALKLAHETVYPVVVTDLRLPRRDGVSLIRELKKSSPISRFIISTGAANLDLASDTGLDPVITSIVSKPWERNELVEAVTRAFSIALMQDGFDAQINEGGFLILEDNDWDAELLCNYLRSAGGPSLPITRAVRLDTALDRLAREEFSVVIADLSLPDARGFDSVTRLHRARPDLPIIILTGIKDERLARHAVQFGAQDYLVKGTIDRETLVRAVRHATERKRAEQRLTFLSRHDDLTGLANRTLLRERVADTILRSRRREEGFGILLIDLDHFKVINDQLGHAAGDEVLREVGARIREVIREVDLAARIGGDEFAILADAPIDPVGAAALATRLSTRLREPFLVAGRELSVTASIGGALFPDGGETLEDLIDRADTNMYSAKNEGRNRYVLAGAFDGADRQLLQAVEEGEFVLHYQPQFSLKSGQPVLLEALLRWNRDDALVSPGVFLPLLEEEGLMGKVGNWVLDEACAHLARLSKPGLRVSVNVSPCQLESVLFAADVESTLAHYALPPDSIEIEVSEAFLTRVSSPGKFDQMHRTLGDLHTLGVRLAIDDFGTGDLSLNRLSRFPIQALKIDRSFIRRLDPPENQDGMLVNAVIGFAKNLQLDVVAEGIESKRQLDTLRHMGCDFGQGYFLGRPSAPESIPIV